MIVFIKQERKIRYEHSHEVCLLSDGDSLVVPADCEVLVATGDAALFGTDKLAGVALASGAKVNFKSIGSDVTIVAPFSGNGVVAVTDSGTVWVRFKGDNSGFNGSFDFNNSTISLDSAKGFGNCPITGVGPSTGSKSWFCFTAPTGTVLSNPMNLTSPNGFTFESYNRQITFAGAVTLSGTTTRFLSGNNGASTGYTFTGEVTVNGNLYLYMPETCFLRFSQKTTLDMNHHIVRNVGWNGTKVIFDCPVTNFRDATHGTTYLEVGSVLSGNTIGTEYTFNADIVGDDAKGLALQLRKGAVDLSGHEIRVGNGSSPNDGALSLITGTSKLITASKAPGTFAVCGMVLDASEGTYDGRLGGHVTLNYDSRRGGNLDDAACWVMALTNQAGEESDTDGDIIATKGHLTLKTGLKLPKVGNLISKADGRITIRDGVAINPKANAKVYGAGTIDIPTGVNVSVAYLYVNDVRLNAGVYSKTADPAKGVAALSCLVGDGTLTVTKPSGISVILR